MSRGGRPTLRHRLEFAAYRGVAALVGRLPESWALAVGSFLGWLAGGVVGIRRSVVDVNLKRSFPDRDPPWRHGVAVESYRHLGREAVMTLRLARADAGDVVGRTRFEGEAEEMIRRASGGGVVCVTGHLGNWEVGGSAVAARGVRVEAVAFRQRNPLFDRELVESRGRLGLGIIPRGHARARVPRALRDGALVALVGDQNAGRSGIFVEFLGRPASTARGPALFSIRTGAPLFAAVCLAEPGRPRRYVLHCEEIRAEPTGDLDEDVRRLTRAHTDFLARFVHRAPEQYFWQHKRWKTRPGDGRRTPV